MHFKILKFKIQKQENELGYLIEGMRKNRYTRFSKGCLDLFSSEMIGI